MVVEALLVAIYLGNELDTYRHKKTLSVEYLSRPIKLVPVQLNLSSWFLPSCDS
jgi:hypothetical protein